jgi:hypothetical protein
MRVARIADTSTVRFGFKEPFSSSSLIRSVLHFGQASFWAMILHFSQANEPAGFDDSSALFPQFGQRISFRVLPSAHFGHFTVAGGGTGSAQRWKGPERE